MSNTLASPEAQTEEFELIAENEDLREVEGLRGPVHTASRIYQHDRERYDMMVTALRGGVSITALSKSHRIGTHTVYAIIAREWGDVSAYHAELATLCKSAARLGVDRIMELIPDAKSLSEVSIATGVLLDKAQQLSGAPQLRVDVNVRHDHSGLIEKLQAAQQLMRQAQGVVLEAESGTVAGEVGLLGECVLPDGLIPAAVPGAVVEERRAA